MNDKQTLTLEAGKFYRTESGKKAYVAAASFFGEIGNGINPYTVCGFIEGCGAVSWTWEGKQVVGCDSLGDLVAEWTESKRIKGWVNIRLVEGGVNFGVVHDTQAAALSKKDVREPVFACIEIDVLEGAGLEGEVA
ncbi:hypothetical protein ACC761_06405 [Rhizobium ruizarguesonis]